MDNSRTPTIVNSPDSETETPIGSHPSRSIPITRGRRLPSISLCHLSPSLLPRSADEVIYKECQKNHAAAMGGLSLDGCGGYIAPLSADPSNPITLKCMVCDCHRNFHRCEKDDSPAPEYVFLGHHQPAPLRSHGSHLNPNPDSPPPPPPPPNSSSYYHHPPAPHTALSLNSARPTDNRPSEVAVPVQVVSFSAGCSRKRHRTKFSCEQKEKMQELAEKLDWRMQKSEENLIETFCRDVGVERSVFKVWMHNNKTTLGKRGAAGNGVALGTEITNSLMIEGNNDDITSPHHENVANGSSSSSFEH
ncbi:zinc-finger homeodomain protein 8-like [Impatiens glandulifera]|uniref:zinc-finger homeodomain protein 8-like n=1 Tax=Impatiens glandulifera TaxID=253017 RepID=UPI001FB153BD|nr:zinc-finger homeodomain protein 8-like [Impatiens glandulifera]